ncbi:MAG TPA: type III-A CRISPR-associated RAMP protein Csm3 [Ferroplasma sp.]|nr:type III-A CRISPR-associated RAMP protein Csm3 [Ferroplasma sp.]
MDDNQNAWKYNLVYRLDITVKTGLHIGGTSEELKIGGTDSPVITTIYNRNGKILDFPYIPGSSIKGKMRSLLSAVSNEADSEKINLLFGNSQTDTGIDRKTRLIIRDAFLSDEELYKYLENGTQPTEIKGENFIDPIKGIANPRFIERIKPGVKFTTNIIILVYKDDDENAMKKILKEGINLLMDSYLGGNGTRGYGNVLLELSFVEQRDKAYYEGIEDGTTSN